MELRGLLKKELSTAAVSSLKTKRNSIRENFEFPPKNCAAILYIRFYYFFLYRNRENFIFSGKNFFIQFDFGFSTYILRLFN